MAADSHRFTPHPMVTWHPNSDWTFATPSAAVMLHKSFLVKQVQSMWQLISTLDSPDTALDFLSYQYADSMRSLPGFAITSTDKNRKTVVIVRGLFVVTVTDAQGNTTTVEGKDRFTWTYDSFSDVVSLAFAALHDSTWNEDNADFGADDYGLDAAIQTLFAPVYDGTIAASDVIAAGKGGLALVAGEESNTEATNDSAVQLNDSETDNADAVNTDADENPAEEASTDQSDAANVPDAPLNDGNADTANTDENPADEASTNLANSNPDTNLSDEEANNPETDPNATDNAEATNTEESDLANAANVPDAPLNDGNTDASENPADEASTDQSDAANDPDTQLHDGNADTANTDENPADEASTELANATNVDSNATNADQLSDAENASENQAATTANASETPAAVSTSENQPPNENANENQAGSNSEAAIPDQSTDSQTDSAANVSTAQELNNMGNSDEVTPENSNGSSEGVVNEVENQGVTNANEVASENQGTFSFDENIDLESEFEGNLDFLEDQDETPNAYADTDKVPADNQVAVQPRAQLKENEPSLPRTNYAYLFSDETNAGSMAEEIQEIEAVLADEEIDITNTQQPANLGMQAGDYNHDELHDGLTQTSSAISNVGTHEELHDDMTQTGSSIHDHAAMANEMAKIIEAQQQARPATDPKIQPYQPSNARQSFIKNSPIKPPPPSQPSSQPNSQRVSSQSYATNAQVSRPPVNRTMPANSPITPPPPSQPAASGYSTAQQTGMTPAPQAGMPPAPYTQAGMPPAPQGGMPPAPQGYAQQSYGQQSYAPAPQAGMAPPPAPPAYGQQSPGMPPPAPANQQYGSAYPQNGYQQGQYGTNQQYGSPPPANAPQWQTANRMQNQPPVHQPFQQPSAEHFSADTLKKPANVIPGADNAVEMMGKHCPNGHTNSPQALNCRVCDEQITEAMSHILVTDRGTLTCSNGQTLGLDQDIVIGRQPKIPAGSQGKTLFVQSPLKEISRSHLRVKVTAWNVLIEDLGSNNGTILIRNNQQPHRLSAHKPIPVRTGDFLDLGDGITLTFREIA